MANLSLSEEKKHSQNFSTKGSNIHHSQTSFDFILSDGNTQRYCLLFAVLMGGAAEFQGGDREKLRVY